MTHRSTLKVRFGELDPYNHVNHSVYVAWFEAGRGEALESIGLGLDTLAERGWQVVVTDLEVRYRRPAVAGDTVVVETWASEVGRVTSRWSQRIVRREADGTETVLCEAEVRAGSTDAHGKPLRMAAEMTEALRALERSAGTEA